MFWKKLQLATKKRFFYWNDRNDKKKEKFKLGKSRNWHNSPFTASPRIWREARPAMFGSSMKITLVDDLVCLCNNGESGSNTHLWNSLLLLLFFHFRSHVFLIHIIISSVLICPCTPQYSHFLISSHILEPHLRSSYTDSVTSESSLVMAWLACGDIIYCCIPSYDK